MNKLNLKDAWRSKNPTKIQFTWCTKYNQIYRRLDFWLVSKKLLDLDDVISCDIRPAIRTDHRAISIKTGFDEAKRGPGYWKFNNELLTNIDYQNYIKKIIKKTKTNEINLSPNLLWELIKVKVKDASIYYGNKINKEKNRKKEKLQKQIKQLNDALINNVSNFNENIEAEIQEKTKIIEKIYDSETKGAYIRSRKKWIEEGERNTKYLCSLEKARGKKKVITMLCKESGEVITDQRQILAEQLSFFKQLYNQSVAVDDVTEATNTFIENENFLVLKKGTLLYVREKFTLSQVHPTPSFPCLYCNKNDLLK